MATATLTAEERQQRLNEASDKYMRGEIAAEEFEEATRQYALDYRPAMRALAESLRTSDSDQHQATASPQLEIALFVLAILLVLIALLQRIPHRESERKAA